MSKTHKSIYTSSLLTLTRMFVNNDLTVDEFKDGLHLLCENYRKEYKNGSKT